MRLQILFTIFLLMCLSFAISLKFSWFYAVFSVIVFVFVVSLRDALQKSRAILRNFPFVGHFRYMLESVRPEIQQYFIESDTDGKPIARVYRSLVYQRAKLETDTIPFGTQLDVYADGYEWLNHSLYPTKVDEKVLCVTIGGKDCSKPYSASMLNIAGMSYGSLSKTAVLALSKGAKMGGFFHNTGEGGISPYHLEGGADLVWQIGTGYFGCRNNDGTFSEELFEKRARHEQVKMVEIKLSQGAKPGHGGILPGKKVNAEIAKIRGVEVGKTVYSPASHSAFTNPTEMLLFVSKLRELSGGKPIGIKICIGRKKDFHSICRAMVDTGIVVDFITIDGGEGGTGAAPLELTNNVGYPLEDALAFAHDCLRGYNLRNQIKVIASGKVLSAFHIMKKLALGADLTASARGMMLASGCIQALRCNANNCPTGVATTQARYYKGLDPTDKSHRVYNYHKKTMHALKEMIEVAGATSTVDINRTYISRRGVNREVFCLTDIYPEQQEGSFL